MDKKIKIDTKEFKAFIFDMDGLLLDTEKICRECFRKACAEFDYEPDFNIYKKCIGLKAEEGNKILKEGFDPFIPFNEVKVKWNDIYRDHIENEHIPLKNGVREILEFLSKKNILLAVATSTERKIAEKKLSKTGIIDFFDIIVTGDQVTNSKPDPEIYLMAAEFLNVNPTECIAFEDSDNGVKSAFYAGMNVIQIIDLIEPSDEVRKLNHTIVTSFNDLRIK